MPEPRLDDLFDGLREQALARITPPGQDAVRRTVRRRRMTRRLTAAAAVVLVIAVGVFLTVFRVEDRTVTPVNPPTPSPTASPTPSTSPSARLDARSIDWTSGEYDLPELTSCPAAGGLRFSGGTASRDGTRWQINGGSGWTGPVYADINQDGTTDAFLRISCGGGTPGSYDVVAAFASASGAVVLHRVEQAGQMAADQRKSVATSGGTVRITEHYPNGDTSTVAYRWNGHAFARTDRQNTILGATLKDQKISLPAIGACPARRVTFRDSIGGNPTDRIPGWMIESPRTLGSSQIGDLDGDGLAEAGLVVTCFTYDKETRGSLPSGAAVVVVGPGDGGSVRQLGVVSVVSGQDPILGASIKAGVLTVTANEGTSRYRWNGSKLVTK